MLCFFALSWALSWAPAGVSLPCEEISSDRKYVTIKMIKQVFFEILTLHCKNCVSRVWSNRYCKMKNIVTAPSVTSNQRIKKCSIEIQFQKKVQQNPCRTGKSRDLPIRWQKSSRPKKKTVIYLKRCRFPVPLRPWLCPRWSRSWSCWSTTWRILFI